MHVCPRQDIVSIVHSSKPRKINDALPLPWYQPYIFGINNEFSNIYIQKKGAVMDLGD